MTFLLYEGLLCHVFLSGDGLAEVGGGPSGGAAVIKRGLRRAVGVSWNFLLVRRTLRGELWLDNSAVSVPLARVRG